MKKIIGWLSVHRNREIIYWIGGILSCLSTWLLSNDLEKSKATISHQSDLLGKNQVELRILKNRNDTLKANNARLNIELVLNNCNQYKIHEKISAIPHDSLLVYADSLLSRPIPKIAAEKGRNIGRAIKKLLGISGAVSRPKSEGCNGDCGHD